MNKLVCLRSTVWAIAIVTPVALGVPGCKSKTESTPQVGSAVAKPAQQLDAAPLPPVPGTADHSGAPGVIHGDKWQDDQEEGGGFKSFKETWIYVDGEPIATMLIAELPAMPVAWTAQEEDIDFVLGQPGDHKRRYFVRRWRLTDYLAALGVPLAKIKMVYLHAGAGALAIPGDVLRKFADGIRFDLTGMDQTKSRFFFPDEMPRFGGFDRYAGVSVIIDKPVLQIDEHKNLLQNGVEVKGIPYHGNPERGGIRIYRDGRLALVIKRNTLGAAGRVTPTEPTWDFAAVLKANGASAADIAAADIVYRGGRKRVDGAMFANLQFATNSQASGEILIGAASMPANSILLYSKGHVPKDEPLPPEEKDAPVPPKPSQK